MPSKVVPPSIRLNAFSCPRCGALTDQTWYELYATKVDSDSRTPFVVDDETIARFISLTEEDELPREMRAEHIAYLEQMKLGDISLGATFSSNYARTPLQNVSISKCYTCKNIALWRYKSIIYPPTQYEIEPNDDLADDIKADFNEARSILDLSPRGAAGLLRLCIQKLCKQIGQPGKNINDDIAALVKAGLDPKVQKALDFVRVIGNEAVHPGTIDLKDDRDTAAKLFALVNRIAYDMITHPKEVDALYDTLPVVKKNEIAKRDGKAVVP